MLTVQVENNTHTQVLSTSRSTVKENDKFNLRSIHSWNPFCETMEKMMEQQKREREQIQKCKNEIENIKQAILQKKQNHRTFSVLCFIFFIFWTLKTQQQTQ